LFSPVRFREEVGPDAARKFLGHTQWLVNYWLLQKAFSIGSGDTIADAATMEKINETISKAKNDVKDLIKQFHDKQLEAEPGRTMMESFENRVNQVLSARASFFHYTVLYSFRSLSKAVFGVLV
jgi:DNA-directed RNA polymerase II subunit RPB1